MRTDSTHLLAVVERLSQYELVAESLRMAVLAVDDAAEEWSEEALPEAYFQAYSQRQSEYGLSEHQVKERLVKAGRDGFWFLAQVDHSGPAVVRQLSEVATLRTVLEQQFPEGPGKPPRAKRPSGKKVIESPHETEARYGTKRGKEWLGYKVQVTETYDPQLPHLIVDLEATGALDNDSPELPHIQARLAERDLLPAEQQTDQGYMSGQNLVHSAQLGITLMGVPLADTQGPPGFRQSDFQIDEQAQQAICPAGHSSRTWAHRHLPHVQEPAIQIRFASQTCQSCPFFGR
jgi:transposase